MTLLQKLQSAGVVVPPHHHSSCASERETLMKKIIQGVQELIQEQGGFIRQYELKLLSENLRTSNGEPFPDAYLTSNQFLEGALRQRKIRQRLLRDAYKDLLGADVILTPENLRHTYIWYAQEARLQTYLKALAAQTSQNRKLLVVKLREPEYSALSSKNVGDHGLVERSYPTRFSDFPAP